MVEILSSFREDLGSFDPDRKYDSYHNSLPSVEEAEKELIASAAMEDFLEASKKIIVKHQLEKAVGLRLIHKHFSVEAGEIMMEEFLVHGEEPALVTHPVDTEKAKSAGALPASWILSENGNFEVFETSTDPAIKRNIDLINREFLKEMGELLRERKMFGMLALAILRRDALGVSSGQAYLEKTYPKQSIVKLRERSELSKHIRTSWSFSSEVDTLACEPDAFCDRSGDTHKQIDFHNDGSI
mmetsp:Transcript_71439/g.83105  ORF Transcript_71439/g.83105 Transcript_71439/m.83105 type:complete len:242 (+) Transcript_71439:24-749(+)|eukprot:CAMPEP_0176420972 /NCGR_PEP_ID=MMETSP0127-20121128/8908_1 /TAXON_ID=938130 /ORGANISM="Platyophrya macrostoma, Strain WH" /LENGTH=241 /DNA_ID=CAMNT_0017801637 /DNA_START=24 /DNA_END=749 /DNA_ORIENTATION=+